MVSATLWRNAGLLILTAGYVGEPWSEEAGPEWSPRLCERLVSFCNEARFHRARRSRAIRIGAAVTCLDELNAWLSWQPGGAVNRDGKDLALVRGVFEDLWDVRHQFSPRQL